MKKVALILATFIFAIVTVQAQNKTKMQARPSEEKEIRGDNYLGKLQQQKQLKVAPEKIADSIATLKAVKPATGKSALKKMSNRKKKGV